MSPSVFKVGEDVLSFQEVYNQYSKVLYDFVYMKLKDDGVARGIVDSALLNASKFAATSSEHLRKYLFKACRNHIINHIRKEKKHSNHENCYKLTVVDRTENVESVIEKRELWNVVSYEVKQLPEWMREIIFLYYDCGHTLKEIANIKRIPEHNVYQRKYLALRQLKSQLLGK
ncbi:hypothetical protein FLA_0455 [Filimonas lacunae]|nr:hypothetical protein FLA_0455 [Filimonas lacunae]